MALVKDGVSESGTICDGAGEEGQNTILRLDRLFSIPFLIFNFCLFGFENFSICFNFKYSIFSYLQFKASLHYFLFFF